MSIEHGFLVIDKPVGITSHDVVKAVRAVTGIAKVGHTGTLDPFATGVLALAFGHATKLIQYLDESIKVYDATVRLGFATDTGDLTGQSIREAPLPTLTRDEVDLVVQGFLGNRMQTPPAYSAVKKQGKPLYYYARKGIEVEVEARPVSIQSIEILSYEPHELRLVIHCSRGTYARVLADEIATALGSAGHLVALARLRSGPFFLDDALTMPALSAMVAADPALTWNEVLFGQSRDRTQRVPWLPRDSVRAGVEPFVRTALQALPHLGLVEVDARGARLVRAGHTPPEVPRGVPVGGFYLVVDGPEVLAVGEVTSRGPKVVKVLDGSDA
jgi:tRNA pseudouridine55 synthase